MKVKWHDQLFSHTGETDCQTCHINLTEHWCGSAIVDFQFGQFFQNRKSLHRPLDLKPCHWILGCREHNLLRPFKLTFPSLNESKRLSSTLWSDRFRYGFANYPSSKLTHFSVDQGRTRCALCLSVMTLKCLTVALVKVIRETLEIWRKFISGKATRS